MGSQIPASGLGPWDWGRDRPSAFPPQFDTLKGLKSR